MLSMNQARANSLPGSVFGESFSLRETNASKLWSVCFVYVLFVFQTSSSFAAPLTHQISAHRTITVRPHPAMEQSSYSPDGPGKPTETTPSTTDVSEVQVHSNDDLPELECAVCFSQFNNVFNMPKVLQCGHTFCLECLARINIKSSQPASLQCPLCRAYTPVPSLGLPKLDTDVVVLSCLPEGMQHVYSIRFNRNRGKLQVKRIPSSIPASLNNQRCSLDLRTPVSTDEDQDTPSRGAPFFTRLMRIPMCRALLMISAMLIMVSLTIGISILLSTHK